MFKILLALICHQLNYLSCTMLTLLGIRHSFFKAMKISSKLHGITYTENPENKAVCSENCIFLANHRTLFDGVIDNYITGGSGSLARMLTIAPNPFGSLFGYINNRIILFNRNEIKRDLLQNKVKSFLQYNSLIVYPEGHRQLTDKSLPLKYGIIRMAYRLQTPVQIIMTTNKEKVFSLHTRNCHYGVACHITVDSVLYPSSCNDIDTWCHLVEERWHHVWDKHHDMNGAIPFDPVPIDKPTNHTRLNISRTIFGSLCIGSLFYFQRT